MLGLVSQPQLMLPFSIPGSLLSTPGWFFWGSDASFLRALRFQNNNRATAAKAMTPTGTPTPIPILASTLRLVGSETGVVFVGDDRLVNSEAAEAAVEVAEANVCRELEFPIDVVDLLLLVVEVDETIVVDPPGFSWPIKVNCPEKSSNCESLISTM